MQVPKAMSAIPISGSETSECYWVMQDSKILVAYSCKFPNYSPPVYTTPLRFLRNSDLNITCLFFLQTLLSTSMTPLPSALPSQGDWKSSGRKSRSALGSEVCHFQSRSYLGAQKITWTLWLTGPIQERDQKYLFVQSLCLRGRLGPSTITWGQNSPWHLAPKLMAYLLPMSEVHMQHAAPAKQQQ